MAHALHSCSGDPVIASMVDPWWTFSPPAWRGLFSWALECSRTGGIAGMSNSPCANRPTMNTREWHLKRNCSLSPRQLALAYAVICAMSITVAMACIILHGVWQILLFTLLELAAVAAAFLSYARHATDYEHIALMDNCLLVELDFAGDTEETRLDPQWTRIAGPGKGRELVGLEARGVRVQVGRFVTEEGRRRLALELRLALRALPGLAADA